MIRERNKLLASMVEELEELEDFGLANSPAGRTSVSMLMTDT
jgi:hypothetical protein